MKRFSLLALASLSLALSGGAGCASSVDEGTTESALRTLPKTRTTRVTDADDPSGMLGDMAKGVLTSLLQREVMGVLFPSSSLDVEALLARIDDKVREEIIKQALRDDKTYLTAAMSKLHDADIEKAHIGEPNAKTGAQIYQDVVSDSTMNNVELVIAALGPDAEDTFRKQGLSLFVGAAQMRASRLALQIELSPGTSTSDKAVLLNHLRDSVKHVELTMGQLRGDDTVTRRNQIGACIATHHGSDHWNATFSDDAAGYSWSDMTTFREQGKALAFCNTRRDAYRVQVDAAYSATLDAKYTFASSMLDSWRDTIDQLEGTTLSTSSRRTASDFAGAMGYGTDWYGASATYPNMLTGGMTCPLNYNYDSVYGLTNVDWPITLCERPYNALTEPYADFYGMYGSFSGENGNELRNNALTGTFACAGNATSSWRLTYARDPNTGITTDKDIFVCAKQHVPGTKPEYLFGGMYTMGGSAVNPFTGGQSCPAGFQTGLVGGSYRSLGASSTVSDMPLVYCWKKNV